MSVLPTSTSRTRRHIPTVIRMLAFSLVVALLSTAQGQVPVQAVNPPVAHDQAVVTDEDTPRAIILVATDIDGEPLRFSIVSGPANGALGGIPPNVIYTPDADFYGTDRFTFRANDGDQDSNIATVTVTVNPIEDLPVAGDQTVLTAQDTPKAITLTATDGDGDPLRFFIVAAPINGALSGPPPNVTYAPNAGYIGSDSFTFRANDGDQDSNLATVSITVNDPPVAYGQTIATDEDTPRGITLTAADPDSDPLTFHIVSGPTDGTLSGTPPNVTYTPNTDFYGSDSFTFEANDGYQDSNEAAVTITVHPIEDPPTADDQWVNTDEDTPIAIALIASDGDGDPLTYHITDPPFHGTLSGTPPLVTYTPDPDYNGSDIFGFHVNDGKADSRTAWISIQVAPINDPPVANDADIVANEDTSRGITLTGSDVEGDALTFSIAIQPIDGILTGTPPFMTYTPNRDYFGPDSFTFVVSDTQGLTDTAQVRITVNNVNDNPQTTDDRITIREDSGINNLNVTYNDTYLPDPFETLTIVAVTPAAHGRVAIQAAGSQIAYTPDDNYYGQDSFAYSIVDGNGGAATGRVFVTVTNENDPPLARQDSAAMDEDGGSIEIDVLANDTHDPDPPEDLTIVSISDALNGTVTIVSGAERLAYRPDRNYYGTDVFTYRISDRNGGYSTANVRVQVRAVNDRPVAEDDSASTQEDVPVTVDVLANDDDIDGSLDPSSVRITGMPDHGTASASRTDGRITYDPTPDWHGTDTFTYQVCDDADPALCDEAQVNIAVGSVNDAPVSDAGADQTVDTNARVTLNGSASYDPDGNLPLAFRWSRISGPPVVLTDATTESPSFVAPDDPCVITFMLRVIDYGGQGKADLTPDFVVVTVNNQPPISDAGADRIEQSDSLVTLDGSASIDPDGDVPLQYLWTQSGGPNVTLSDPTSASPTFTAPSTASVLTFTLFVTDSLGEPDTTPDQVVITVSEPFYVYLPSVVGRHVIAPDLVVESVVASTRNVQVVIRNQGDAAVTDPFWVDVYINPYRPPIAVNETFDDVGTLGLAWAVVEDALGQLRPGGSLTLRMNDRYYDPDISVFPDDLLPGTPIYAQVDSFNPGTNYGTVLEVHEAIGEPYNNIYGPVLSVDGQASSSGLPPNPHGRPTPPGLPKRP